MIARSIAAMLVPRSIRIDPASEAYQPLLKGRPETGGMRSGLVTLRPGAAVGRHDTGDHEELLIVLSGVGELRLDGSVPLPLSVDATAYCPPHREHDVLNTGTVPLRYIYVVAEAR